MFPLVTAIITTYKRPPNIVERALQSILNQTYKNLEIIVVDDSPQDYDQKTAVAQMVATYPDVLYLTYEANRGACYARNFGTAAAHGEYIAFLDDDDQWLPQKIEKQLSAFTEEEIALVYCRHEVHYEITGETTYPKTKKCEGYIFEELILGNFIGSTSFPLMRTAALREVEGFDPEQEAAQDFDVWLKIAQKFKIAFVDEVLIRYYFHAGDSIGKSAKRRINGCVLINDKYKTYLSKNKNAYWNRWMKVTPEYTKGGAYGKAFITWLKAAARKPFRIKGNISYFWLCFVIFVEKTLRKPKGISS